MKKRGLSVVVSSVLLILLVVVGIIILWAGISKSLNKNTIGGREDCFTLDIEPIKCGFAAAGSWCVQNGGATTQVDIHNNLAYAIIKRNEGEGNLNSAKLVFTNAAGEIASKDLVDLNIPELELDFEKDLSNMLELETRDVAIVSENLFVPIKVEVAPIIGDGVLCEPYTGFFPCKNLNDESYLQHNGALGNSCSPAPVP
jgi:hypothetical protein